MNDYNPFKSKKAVIDWVFCIWDRLFTVTALNDKNWTITWKFWDNWESKTITEIAFKEWAF